MGLGLDGEREGGRERGDICVCVCVCLRIRFKMLRHILHLHANSVLSGGGDGRHFDQIVLKDELSILDIALIALKKKKVI